LEVGRPPFLALQVLINPVNEVLIPDPASYWQRNNGFHAFVRKNGFNIEEENVMSQITRNSRVMSANSPNNPTWSGPITW